MDEYLITVSHLGEILDEGQQFDFTCTGCGDCCGGSGNVYFTGDDLERVYEYLQIPPREQRKFRMKFIRFITNGLHVHSSHTSCFFLQENRCSIYPVRPLQCSTYPFWPSYFQSRQQLKQLKRECPGSLKQKGKVFTPLRTVRLVNGTLRRFTGFQENTEDPVIL